MYSTILNPWPLTSIHDGDNQEFTDLVTYMSQQTTNLVDSLRLVHVFFVVVVCFLSLLGNTSLAGPSGSYQKILAVIHR